MMMKESMNAANDTRSRMPPRPAEPLWLGPGHGGSPSAPLLRATTGHRAALGRVTLVSKSVDLEREQEREP